MNPRDGTYLYGRCFFILYEKSKTKISAGSAAGGNYFTPKISA